MTTKEKCDFCGAETGSLAILPNGKMACSVCLPTPLENVRAEVVRAVAAMGGVKEPDPLAPLPPGYVMPILFAVMSGLLCLAGFIILLVALPLGSSYGETPISDRFDHIKLMIFALGLAVLGVGFLVAAMLAWLVLCVKKLKPGSGS